MIVTLPLAAPGLARVLSVAVREVALRRGR
jgi:hypothetical protein